jgi:glycosyltransferase involved in cell wall biosynthesis
MKSTLSIGAAMMARNAEALVGHSIASLSWVDGIYLYDDNSTDGTIRAAKQATRVPLVVEGGKEREAIFKRGEMAARNAMTNRAFERLGCDVLVLIDSDELMSRPLGDVISEAFADPLIDSLCLSMWHLFDERHYLHFWETHMNGIYMIDPHIRVIRKNKRYQPGFADGSHPFIKTTDYTQCVHGPYHFHMKYHHLSPYPNYALSFLPKRLTWASVEGFLRDLPFTLPDDIETVLSSIDWSAMEIQETDYYGAYETSRVSISPAEALVHPRDLPS